MNASRYPVHANPVDSTLPDGEEHPPVHRKKTLRKISRRQSNKIYGRSCPEITGGYPEQAPRSPIFPTFRESIREMCTEDLIYLAIEGARDLREEDPPRPPPGIPITAAVRI